MTVVESRSLNLSVSFTGLPLPNVTLYRNGTMEAFIPNIDTLQYLLPHVTRSDAGLYTVIASNMAGEAKSEFQVIVRCTTVLVNLINSYDSKCEILCRQATYNDRVHTKEAQDLIKRFV